MSNTNSIDNELRSELAYQYLLETFDKQPHLSINIDYMTKRIIDCLLYGDSSRFKLKLDFILEQFIIHEEIIKSSIGSQPIKINNKLLIDFIFSIIDAISKHSSATPPTYVQVRLIENLFEKEDYIKYSQTLTRIMDYYVIVYMA